MFCGHVACWVLICLAALCECDSFWFELASCLICGLLFVVCWAGFGWCCVD